MATAQTDEIRGPCPHCGGTGTLARKRVHLVPHGAGLTACNEPRPSSRRRFTTDIKMVTCPPCIEAARRLLPSEGQEATQT